MPKQVKSVVVGFKTTEQVADRLKKLAELNGTTVSDLCNRIIESFLNKESVLIKWTILRPKPLMKFLTMIEKGGGVAITIERGEK